MSFHGFVAGGSSGPHVIACRDHKLAAVVLEPELIAPALFLDNKSSRLRSAGTFPARTSSSWFTYDKISYRNSRSTSTRALTTVCCPDMYSSLFTRILLSTAFPCGWRKSPSYTFCTNSTDALMQAESRKSIARSTSSLRFHDKNNKAMFATRLSQR